MAMTVNGDPHPWREGLTVTDLLREKSYVFPMKVIYVNKQLIDKKDLASTVLKDGDVVDVVHLIGGG